jgi:hypothetical protein
VTLAAILAISTTHAAATLAAPTKGTHMGYGIGGILVLILVILAIVYFAKRV